MRRIKLFGMLSPSLRELLVRRKPSIRKMIGTTKYIKKSTLLKDQKARALNLS